MTTRTVTYSDGTTRDVEIQFTVQVIRNGKHTWNSVGDYKTIGGAKRLARKEQADTYVKHVRIIETAVSGRGLANQPIVKHGF
jgi:hypothetical protein